MGEGFECDSRFRASSDEYADYEKIYEGEAMQTCGQNEHGQKTPPYMSDRTCLDYSL